MPSENGLAKDFSPGLKANLSRSPPKNPDLGLAETGKSSSQWLYSYVSLGIIVILPISCLFPAIVIV
jgi:hypothetical protein